MAWCNATPVTVGSEEGRGVDNQLMWCWEATGEYATVLCVACVPLSAHPLVAGWCWNAGCSACSAPALSHQLGEGWHEVFQAICVTIFLL
jgi:hypothetical protein